MNELSLKEAMEELCSAEDFLQFFGLSYEPSIVHVNRLHILQRFHDYIEKYGALPEDESLLRQIYTELLRNAYQDFVQSDAITEKVFKVFHMHQPQETFVSLDNLFK